MPVIAPFAAILIAASTSAQAAPTGQQEPQTLTRLMACRSISDSAARLACYDAAAGEIDSARQQGDLVVIDRAQAEETRRQLFGFEVPTLPRLFGGEAQPDIESIETTLQSASRASETRWVFRLADGSVWRQIDSDPVRFQNRAGQEVRVRKASLGSFLLTVGNSRAVRVRRQ